jgi:hypothetical protein
MNTNPSGTERRLPGIPFAPNFRAFAAAGKELARLHLDYEKLEPYPLKWIESPGVPLERQSLQSLDHKRLRGFRDEFDAIHAESNPQARGNRFQDLLNRIFDYYCEESKGAFERTGEQVDGLFYFDKHWYFVEIRWKKEKAKAADISVLRDRAKNAYGGDTKALFISFNGFSEECIQSLRTQGDERVILMDGYDLRCVLDCQIGFDLLLAEKQAEVVKNKRPFIGAAEVIEKRKTH